MPASDSVDSDDEAVDAIPDPQLILPCWQRNVCGPRDQGEQPMKLSVSRFLGQKTFVT